MQYSRSIGAPVERHQSILAKLIDVRITLCPVLVLLLSGNVASGQFTPITEGEGVSFLQDQFQFDGQPTDTSGTGTVVVDPATLLSATQMSSGYLNIQDSSGWVVQNLPVDSAVGPITSQLNLGTPDGSDDTGAGLTFSVDISTNPVTSFSPTAATHFSLGTNTYDEEGEGAIAGNPGPPAANAITFLSGGLINLTLQPGHPNVQTADNQCGPAALANELAFLKASYGLNIPDPNIAGRGDPGTGNLFVPSGAGMETAGNSLVGRLDLSIGRNSTSRTSGTTTTGTTQLNGLLSYLGSARVNDAGAVAVKYQGNIPGPTQTQSGITATSQGNSVTANFIFSQLAAGNTVKLGMSGHAVDVIGAGTILGVPWVLYNSDLKQTPIDATDAALGTNPTFAFLVNNTLVGEVGTPQVFNDISVQVVPEARFLPLFLLGSLGLVFLHWRDLI
jgi:hypothetical protein